MVNTQPYTHCVHFSLSLTQREREEGEGEAEGEGEGRGDYRCISSYQASKNNLLLLVWEVMASMLRKVRELAGVSCPFCVAPGDQSQVVNLGNDHLYLLSF